jgi:hypothetical protein
MDGQPDIPVQAGREAEAAALIAVRGAFSLPSRCGLPQTCVSLAGVRQRINRATPLLSDQIRTYDADQVGPLDAYSYWEVFSQEGDRRLASQDVTDGTGSGFILVCVDVWASFRVSTSWDGTELLLPLLALFLGRLLVLTLVV